MRNAPMLLIPFILCGCMSMSSEDQLKVEALGVEIAELTKKSEQYGAQLLRLPDRVKAGEISAEEGIKLAVELGGHIKSGLAARYKAQKIARDIEAKSGTSPWITYGWLALSVIAAGGVPVLGVKIRTYAKAINGMTGILHGARVAAKKGKGDAASKALEEVIESIALLENKAIDKAAKKKPHI